MKMVLRLCLFWFSLCHNSVDGFLLESLNVHSGNKSAASNGQNQYVTVDEFLKFELQQHENDEQIRHSTAQLRDIMQRTFGLLSSQLNEQLKQLDAKLYNNNSFDLELKHKYTLLEGNFTNIKRELSETYNKYTLLEVNFTDIQQRLSETEDKNRKLQEKLDEMAAKETTLEKEIATLKTSTQVQSQLNTSRLFERVTNVEAKTLQLQQNQMARGQDFLAIYNDTIHLKETIGVFKNQLTTFANSTTDQISKLYAANNNTHQRIDLLNGRLTSGFSNISGQMREISRKVALTACAGNQNEHTGYIVKFPKIKTSVGITSTSSFVSMGKFQCEYDGVYLVSADITAFNTNVDYFIMFNGNQYEFVYEQNNKVVFQRGVISVTLDLHKGDNIWIQLRGDMYVDAASSCLTIVKIK